MDFLLHHHAWDGDGGENPSVISQVTVEDFLIILLSVCNVWDLEMWDDSGFCRWSWRNSQSLFYMTEMNPKQWENCLFFFNLWVFVLFSIMKHVK
jgi:hypothetical protein